ncbi:MAG: hypothetical protein KAJ52_06350, partial [Sedimentisphaerales bacterium]|nr:hypothetical protein [Sedimentisphaerales bacterium]
NHDELLAEALFCDTPFFKLLDLPHSRPLGFDPSIVVSLSDDCRLQGRLSLESRTGAYQLRSGKYKEDDQLSLYLSVRQYPDPNTGFDSLKAYDRQRTLAEEIMDDKVIPNFVNPILSHLGHRG